jgi:hypothetical protein
VLGRSAGYVPPSLEQRGQLRVVLRRSADLVEREARGQELVEPRAHEQHARRGHDRSPAPPVDPGPREVKHAAESSPASAPDGAAGEAGSFRYYRHTGGLALASRLSLRVRRRMYELFVSYLRPDASTRILDLGVTSEDDQPESNYLEQWYPHPERIVCAGTQDASVLERRHPGVRFVRIRADERLPFADREFDVLFSSAVVEHVGGAAAQRRFVAEGLRVARAFFITTPNRWFPVELHTALPLLHYLPPLCYRPVYRTLGFGGYASEETLNLLDARTFLALFPSRARVRMERVRLLGIPSNLVALGASGPA